MPTETSWTRKDLTDIESLSKEEILAIFETAKSFQNPSKPLHALEGKTIINLFAEPSTRTRVSFEVAAQNLAANTIHIQASASSFTKGESLRDTAENIVALNASAIVLRHSAPGSAHYLSQIVPIPVINAGDGAHEHPTQALLDTFTLSEKWGSADFSGKKITILGDILFSRVARSNIWALQKLGAHVTLAGPSTLVPETFASMGAEISHNLKDALKDADAVMLLRIQHERQTSTHFPSLGEYKNMFGLNKLRASWLKKDALIMHPGPINRGVEIDSAIADSPNSIILDQVSAGIPIRMAALYLTIAATSTVDQL